MSFYILYQIEQLNEENIKLRQRQKELETKALDAISEKKIFQEKLKNVPQDIPQPASEDNSEKIDAKEVEELSEAFKVVPLLDEGQKLNVFVPRI